MASTIFDQNYRNCLRAWPVAWSRFLWRQGFDREYRSLIVSPLEMPRYYNDLMACLEHAYHLLSLGRRDRHHGFHAPTLITQGLDGHPQGRVVVLRGWQPKRRAITFHTDIRSNGFEQLQACGRALWVFYDRDSKVQLRIHSHATLHHHDDEAQAAWSDLGVSARRVYMSHLRSGTINSQPSSGIHERIACGQVSSEDHRVGFQNFAVVTCVIESIDWLYLSALGNRRARFQWLRGDLEANWLIP